VFFHPRYRTALTRNPSTFRQRGGKTRLKNRKYDVIQFRNGYATDAPEMQVEFLGVRRIKKDGKNVYAIRLGKILKIKRWKNEKIALFLSLLVTVTAFAQTTLPDLAQIKIAAEAGDAAAQDKRREAGQLKLAASPVNNHDTGQKCRDIGF